jgi:hypothetical protein
MALDSSTIQKSEQGSFQSEQWRNPWLQDRNRSLLGTPSQPIFQNQ